MLNRRRTFRVFNLLLLAALAAFPASCRRSSPLKPYVAYVVNRQSATLAAVNLAEFRVAAMLPVARQPDRVLARPHAPQLYVVSSTGKITVTAYPRFHLVTTLDVGKGASSLSFSPDGLFAYVLNPADHELVFINCGASGRRAEESMPRISHRLHLPGVLTDAVLSPDGKTLVVASQNPHRLSFISSETRQLMGTVEVGQAPGPMVILPDSSKVFVVDTGEDKISIADLPGRKLLSHLELGTRPTTLLLKPDGGEIFAIAASTSTLVIIDAFHDEIEQAFPLGQDAVTGVFRRDMGALYIANAGDGSVLAMDPQTRQVLASTHVGMSPVAVALTPDERLLVAADRAASSLAIMRADPSILGGDRSALITTIPVGAEPVDVIVPSNSGP